MTCRVRCITKSLNRPLLWKFQRQSPVSWIQIRPQQWLVAPAFWEDFTKKEYFWNYWLIWSVARNTKTNPPKFKHFGSIAFVLIFTFLCEINVTSFKILVRSQYATELDRDSFALRLTSSKNGTTVLELQGFYHTNMILLCESATFTKFHFRFLWHATKRTFPRPQHRVCMSMPPTLDLLPTI